MLSTTITAPTAGFLVAARKCRDGQPRPTRRGRLRGADSRPVGRPDDSGAGLTLGGNSTIGHQGTCATSFVLEVPAGDHMVALLARTTRVRSSDAGRWRWSSCPSATPATRRIKMRQQAYVAPAGRGCAVTALGPTCASRSWTSFGEARRQVAPLLTEAPCTRKTANGGARRGTHGPWRFAMSARTWHATLPRFCAGSGDIGSHRLPTRLDSHRTIPRTYDCGRYTRSAKAPAPPRRCLAC